MKQTELGSLMHGKGQDAEVSRRSFLRVAGSSAVILAAPIGAGGCSSEPSVATEPWRSAGQGYDDARMRALSYAILAPNPHNRQPWLVDLSREDEVTLYCDRTRLLPETDPFSRQIMIGLGCFVELTRMAAQADGWDTDIERFPQGEPGDAIDDRPVAKLRFRRAASVTADPLWTEVLTRRSNKLAYDTDREVEHTKLEALRTEAIGKARIGYERDPGQVARWRTFTSDAWLVELKTERTYMESVNLMRIGADEIAANPDGIELGGLVIEGMKAIGLVSREKLAKPGSIAYQQGRDMYLGLTQSAMAYVWCVTPGNSRDDQLDAGASWVRINLAASRLGVGVHPLSQALQEFPEMRPYYDEIHERLTRAPGEVVQMFARAGYSRPVPATPRWPLESRVQSL